MTEDVVFCTDSEGSCGISSNSGVCEAVVVELEMFLKIIPLAVRKVCREEGARTHSMQLEYGQDLPIGSRGVGGVNACCRS